jgi:ribosome-associated protein
VNHPSAHPTGPKSGSSTSAGSESPADPETTKRIEQSRNLALLAARAGLEKKCLGLEIIQIAERADYADFLVLMVGTSDRHVASIARSVDEELSKAGSPPSAIEGLPRADWVLLDFFDVVVHVFSESAKDLYDISGLWMDAGRIPLPNRLAPLDPTSTASSDR